MTLADQIYLGTCSFTAPGWAGSFYPKGMKTEDRLTFYAEHFDTVEVDSTFYGIPSPHTVNKQMFSGRRSDCAAKSSILACQSRCAC